MAKEMKIFYIYFLFPISSYWLGVWSGSREYKDEIYKKKDN